MATIELHAPWRQRTNADKWWEPDQYINHPAFEDGKPKLVEVDDETAARMIKSGGAAEPGTWEARRQAAAEQAAASAGVDLSGKDQAIAELQAKLEDAKSKIKVTQPDPAVIDAAVAKATAEKDAQIAELQAKVAGQPPTPSQS